MFSKAMYKKSKGGRLRMKKAGTPMQWKDTPKYKGGRKSIRALTLKVKDENAVPVSQQGIGFDGTRDKRMGPTTRYTHKPWPFTRKTA